MCRRKKKNIDSRQYTQKEKQKRHKVRLNVATWNVRTLLDRETSSNSERRTAIVGKELGRYNIDIAALSETRLGGEGHLSEKGAGYTFFWKGKPDGERRTGGVGVAVCTEMASLMEQPQSIGDRIMHLRFPLSRGCFVSVVSVYAPTMSGSQETIMEFYQNLRECIKSIPHLDKVLLLGDFNARVGNDDDAWSALGRHGMGKMNANGLLLLQLCTEFNLIICNTFFQHKEIHKATWIHPRSRHGHILDYIVTRKRDLQDVCSVRVMRGAECGTDHKLLRGIFKMQIKRKTRVVGVCIPKRIDVSKLKSLEMRDALHNALDRIAFDGSWDQFKTQVYKAGVDILGLKKTKSRDWFDENDAAISRLIEDKNKLYVKYLVEEGLGKITSEKAFRDAKSRMQFEIRKMKNNWWSEISAEMQSAYNCRDLKTLYRIIRQVFGPQPLKVAPLKSKDGNILIKDSVGIRNRWTEHFKDLFYNPSIVDDEIIDGLPQREIKTEMLNYPTIEEIVSAVKNINIGKAPGLDGIPFELIRFGGDNVAMAIHDLVLSVWHGGSVPQDWIDAIMISIFKAKGSKSECGDYRGISLLESAGKVLSKVLLDRLIEWICPGAIPETQCGFRAGRGAIDMIFSARQLMEKCIEQQMPLYQVFVDLKKAFDTVNRRALWIILGKLGCPSEFVNMIKKLHENMKARVNFDGVLSEPIAVENGVKQGDILAPTLFSIYFAVLLTYAFQDVELGVYLQFRTSGKVFNLRRFNTKSRIFDTLIREFLYADDADFVAHTVEDMQLILDTFSKACTAFGLNISIKKTKVMYTPPVGEVYMEPDIFVGGERLGVVDSFVYLGSTISRDGTLDAEVNCRIAKASFAFGKLEKRVWSDRGITRNIKLYVYDACIVTILLYGCEAWTIYRRHIRVLERFHQHCIRRILNIKWSSHTPDVVVLEKAGIPSIKKRIMMYQMRWVGHVVRMQDGRLPKQMFYGELIKGKRPQHKPRMRFKDVIKGNLKAMNVDVNNWEAFTKDRDSWRRIVQDGCEYFEEMQLKHATTRRILRKENPGRAPAGIQQELGCVVCGRFLLSRAGLVNHLKSHERKRGRDVCKTALPPCPPSHICNDCGLLCESAGELARHAKLHVTGTHRQFNCHVCNFVCKSRAGLKSHLRAHSHTQWVSPPCPPSYVCNKCDLICKSAGGLARHAKVHGDESQPFALMNREFSCHICSLVCKSRAGLKSHLRAHSRAVDR